MCHVLNESHPIIIKLASKTDVPKKNNKKNKTKKKQLKKQKKQKQERSVKNLKRFLTLLMPVTLFISYL